MLHAPHRLPNRATPQASPLTQRLREGGAARAVGPGFEEPRALIEGPALCAALSPDGSRLAVGQSDGQLVVHDAERGAVTGFVRLGAQVQPVPGALTATGSRRPTVSWRSSATRAEIGYEREVGQLAFGPGRWLGVGLAGGDGNKIELVRGAVHRTEPHPGRRDNSWVLAVQIDRALQRVRQREAE